MPWYVSWAPTPPNGRLGVFITSPHTSIRWTESSSFLSTGTSDSLVRTGHTMFIVRCLPHQPTIGVGIGRPLDPIVTLTIRCTPDSPVLQPEGACLQAPLRRLSGCPTGQFGAHQTCTVYCPVRHQGAGWLPTSWISSLILWASKLFLSSFEVLHPQCLSPILFRILWTTNINTSKHISPQVMLIIKHQNLLSQMGRGPFSLQSPSFGDWWQHNQSKQI
jgi:hypothetical protein